MGDIQKGLLFKRGLNVVGYPQNRPQQMATSTVTVMYVIDLGSH